MVMVVRRDLVGVAGEGAREQVVHFKVLVCGERKLK